MSSRSLGFRTRRLLDASPRSHDSGMRLIADAGPTATLGVRKLQRDRLTSLGPAIPLQLAVHETQFGSSFSIGRFVSPASSNPRGFTRIRIIGPAVAQNSPKCELPSPGLIRWRRVRSADSSSRVMKRRADTLGRTDCPEQELQTAREDRSTSPSPRAIGEGLSIERKAGSLRRSCTLCSDSIGI